MDSSELYQALSRLRRTQRAQITRSQSLTEVSPLRTLPDREASGMMSSEGPHPKEREPPHRCPQDFPHQMIHLGGRRGFWPSRRSLGRHLGGHRFCISREVDPGWHSQTHHLSSSPYLAVHHSGGRDRYLGQWHWYRNHYCSDPLCLDGGVSAVHRYVPPLQQQ